jgi:hypothetical protein
VWISRWGYGWEECFSAELTLCVMVFILESGARTSRIGLWGMEYVWAEQLARHG